MISPERAAEIVSTIDGVNPVYAHKGERKGQHVEKAFRFGVVRKLERHINIASRATRRGVTVYVNKISATGEVFPEGALPGVEVLRFYPKGHTGKDGEKGLSAAAAELPSLLPLKNDVYRLSVGDEANFRRLIDWYFGLGVTKDPVTTPSTAEDAVSSGVRNEDSSINDERVMREILTRRGQPEFRRKLLTAFEATCCITGCTLEAILEAAHIIPHADGSNYSVRNGLLLRSDVHTLFDLHLLGVDETGKVHLDPCLTGTEYEELRGRYLRAPADSAARPDPTSLAKRYQKFASRDRARATSRLGDAYSLARTAAST